MDSYLTIRDDAQAIGEYIDRKSRFISHLVHVETPEQASAHQEHVRSKHYDARHNVPAWILIDGTERASDDGEPQRTSGLPTLTVLREAGLKDVCCVTTRYFGGTLLGPGGLVRAYTSAAQAAIEQAQADNLLVEMTYITPVDVVIDYALYEQVVRLATGCNAKVQASDFTDSVTVHLVFKAGEEQEFLKQLSELVNGTECATIHPSVFAEF